MSSPSASETAATRDQAFLGLAHHAFNNLVEAPAFLFSYQNFITGSVSLFSLWVQEFKRAHHQAQQSRLLEFLKFWMSTYPTDLSSPDHKQILALLSTLESQDENLISEFKRLISLQNTTNLKRLLQTQNRSPSLSSDHKSTNDSPSSASLLSSASASPANAAPPTTNPKTRQPGAVRSWLYRNIKGGPSDTAGRVNGNTAGDNASSNLNLRDEYQDFLGLASLDIARELTMAEFEIFRNIGPRELLCWQKENKHVTAPNIIKLIAKFNEVSYWVATEILRRADAREQARVISKFIKIARLCYHLHNFNSLSEILTGLNNSAVIRLKVAWLCVPDRPLRQFKQLDHLMQPQANYLHYRNASALQQHQPHRPDFRSVTCLQRAGVKGSGAEPRQTSLSLSSSSLIKSKSSASQPASSLSSSCSLLPSVATPPPPLLRASLPSLAVGRLAQRKPATEAEESTRQESEEEENEGGEAASKSPVRRAKRVTALRDDAAPAFLPYRTPRSPRLQWSVEIGNNRDKDPKATTSPRTVNSPSPRTASAIKLLVEENPLFPSDVGPTSPINSSSPIPTGLCVSRGTLPILPYLAIVLRDFIAVGEGNAEYTTDGWINSHLIDLQYQIVVELRHFQTNAYTLPRKKDVRKYLDNLQYEDDDDALYDLSLKSCPMLRPATEGRSSRILNADTAQAYFDAAMNDVSVLLLKKRSCTSPRDMQYAHVPFGTGRERNDSVAFYSMLREGTAGMLERETGRWRERSDYGSGRSSSGRVGVDNYDAEFLLSATSRHGRKWGGKERPKSLQLRNRSQSESSLLERLRERSNSETTRKYKRAEVHQQLQQRRWVEADIPRQEKVTRPASEEDDGSGDDSDDDGENSAAIGSAESPVIPLRSGTAPVKAVKPLTQIKGRFLSFRGRGEITKGELTPQQSAGGPGATSRLGSPRIAALSLTSPRPARTPRHTPLELWDRATMTRTAPEEPNKETTRIVQQNVHIASTSKEGKKEKKKAKITKKKPDPRYFSNTVHNPMLTATTSAGFRTDSYGPPVTTVLAPTGQPPNPEMSACLESVTPTMTQRPAVVPRDRQGSIAFYSALGQGAVAMLREEGILTPTPPFPSPPPSSTH